MFPKNNRLPRTAFRHVFRTGIRIQIPDFSCVAAKTKEPVSRFAVVVSTKVSKHAVDRNRIKRLLREAVRHLLQTILPGYDCIIIAQKNFSEKKETAIENDINGLFSKHGLILEK